MRAIKNKKHFVYRKYVYVGVHICRRVVFWYVTEGGGTERPRRLRSLVARTRHAYEYDVWFWRYRTIRGHFRRRPRSGKKNENTTAGTGDGLTSVAASACAFFGKKISIRSTWNAHETRSIFYITRTEHITGGRLWDDSGHCVCDSRKKTMIVPYGDFEVSPVVRLVISDNRHYSTVCWIHANTLLRGEGSSRGALHLARRSSCGRVTFYERVTTVYFGNTLVRSRRGKWRRIRGGKILIDG